MNEPKVRVSVRSAGDGVNVIDIEGEITAASETALSEAHAEAAEGAGVVVLNFEGLDYMNSGGIGLLVTTLIRANRMGHKLVAYGLNEHYLQIFSLTKLDEAIEIHEDESSAVGVAA